jgi:hypothetical protein
MMDTYYYDSMRLLLQDEEEVPPPKWQLIFMSILMVIMFAFLIADRVAPDHVFVTALAFCMGSGIVDSKEGLKGFANEGVLTVMVSENMRCILERQWLDTHVGISLLTKIFFFCFYIFYRFYLL